MKAITRREIVSGITVGIFITLILVLATSGKILINEYWTALAAALTVASLTVFYWGIKPRVILWEKKNSVALAKEKPQKSVVRLVDTEDDSVDNIKGGEDFDNIVLDERGKRTKIRNVEGERDVSSKEGRPKDKVQSEKN